MAEYSSRFEEEGAYSFNSQSILDLCKIASDFLGEQPGLEIRLQEEHVISGKDVNELLNDLYVKSKPIEQLTISGIKLPGQSISIDLQSRFRSSPPVEVAVRGDRDKCLKARSELETAIRATKQSFWRVVAEWRHSRWLELGTLIVLYIVCLALNIRFISTDKDLAPALSALAFVETWIVAFLLVKLIDKMYPALTFQVGKSDDVYRSAKQWRHNAFSFVVLGIVASLIVGVVLQFFFK